MKKIIFIFMCMMLTVCKETYDLDFNKPVEICINQYDKKDFILFYSEDKSSFVSQSVGVTQFTFIDYKQDRRMLNEYEMEYYNCQTVVSKEHLMSIIQ